jgi:hypothetical protein
LLNFDHLVTLTTSFLTLLGGITGYLKLRAAQNSMADKAETVRTQLVKTKDVVNDKIEAIRVGQDIAAAAAENVRVQLIENQHTAEEAKNVTHDKIEAIHILVNNAHGEALRMVANLAARVAILTKNVADKKLAKEALEAADLHDAKQRIVDERLLQLRGIQTESLGSGDKA